MNRPVNLSLDELCPIVDTSPVLANKCEQVYILQKGAQKCDIQDIRCRITSFSSRFRAPIATLAVLLSQFATCWFAAWIAGVRGGVGEREAKYCYPSSAILLLRPFGIFLPRRHRR